MNLKTLLASSLLCALSIGTASAAAITHCDELASHPEDPDRVIRGLQTGEIDLPAAIAACEIDVKADPDNARLRYQLARVLFYAGKSARAMDEMRIAADAGHAQAQFVYGIFVIKKRPDAPRDPCIAERYWKMSARGGRHAAPVNYALYALRNQFDQCSTDAEPAEVREWLDAARAAAPDGYSGYYRRLLIDDLVYRLALQSQD